MSLNVIKLTGRACFVVRSRPGLVVLDGKKVPCEEIARDIANHLARATGCNAVLVPDWVSIEVVEGEPVTVLAPAPMRAEALDALTRTGAKVRQRADGTWEPADGEPHDAEVADACE